MRRGIRVGRRGMSRGKVIGERNTVKERGIGNGK